MRSYFLAAIALTVFLIVSPARAANIEACGVPDPAVLNTDGVDYCDIYTRQLAYRLTRLEHRKLIEERQKNFAAPRDQALKNYQQALESLNNNRAEKAE